MSREYKAIGISALFSEKSYPSLEEAKEAAEQHCKESGFYPEIGWGHYNDKYYLYDQQKGVTLIKLWPAYP